MTTTVPQMPQAPQGSRSSVNNPAFTGQQIVQPVYVLPPQKDSYTVGWIIALFSVIIGVLGLISVFVLNYRTDGGASFVLGLVGLILAITSRYRGNTGAAGIALGIANMLLGILTVPLGMMLLFVGLMGV